MTPREERDKLIADIRRYLPLLAVDYPELATAIEGAMTTIEKTAAARLTGTGAMLDAKAAHLAAAMLDAKAGASGDFDGAEQMRRTILMAEWVIARLPFHGLALVGYDDALTDDERQDRYRQWLRSRSAKPR